MDLLSLNPFLSSILLLFTVYYSLLSILAVKREGREEGGEKGEGRERGEGEGG